MMKAHTDAPHPPALPLYAIFLALIKFRLLALVLVSTCMGFFVGADGGGGLWPLFVVLLGVTLVGGGANALNQWKERGADARMLRTRLRPLPALRISASQALAFGVLISLAGLTVIALWVNRLTLLLAFASWASYLFVYTPLKSRSVFNTWVGAVPGALPALLGSTAVSGTIDSGGLALFAILYVWQMPHFFAISWVHREDYLRGGFRMLSWNDASGKRTGGQILWHTLLLLPVSVGLWLSGDAGVLYLGVALLAGLVFLLEALRFYQRPDRSGARRVFHYSVIYLPLLFLGLLLDKWLTGL